MISNVAHFLTEQSKSQPHGIAVRAPIGRVAGGAIRYDTRTFAELEAEASGAAHLFSAAGIRRGTRVLLMVKPGLDLIRIVFALFKIGAVPIVIDPGMGLGGFLRCVRHSQPDALVGIPLSIWIARICRTSFEGVRIKIKVSSGFTSRCSAFKASKSFPVVASDANELAAILFTSGSTGPAKGVRYAHGMFAAQVEALRQQYKIEAGEVDLPMLPVFALFNPALGMTTIVPEMNPSRPAAVDPSKIVQAIQQNQVTNTFGSPALWRKIGLYCLTQGIQLPSVQRILMAGAPVPPNLMEQMQAVVPNGEIHTPYGATEALPVASINATEVLESTALRTQAGEGTCVGLPLPGVSIHVIASVDAAIQDFSKVEKLSRGSIGEIIVSGPTVTRSYDRRPDADEAAKIADADGRFWHRMGDLGWLGEDGRLWFCGRKVERVLTASGPLYTDCCEAIFNAHPKVARSALIDAGGGRPAIVVEPEAGAFPRRNKARLIFEAELLKLAQSRAMSAQIDTFFFEKTFPVDVRHNAKIHRLLLARKFSTP